MTTRPSPKVYLRNGTEVFLDPCRLILVPATPEERVRQRFIAYLVAELGVPAECLRTEAHLSHFVEGLSGRADVVICSPDGYPLVILECKAPSVHIGDDAVAQASHYHSKVGARQPVIAITNGCSTRWYRLYPKRVEQLRHAPVYSELLNGRVPAAAPSQPVISRPEPTRLTGRARSWLVSQGVIGEGSDSGRHAFFANLAGLLLLERAEPSLRSRDGWRVVDSGMRDTSFGNAAGGNWSGLYRYFLLQDAQKNVQMISLSVMGKGFEQGHPKFGNMNGHTMLLAAVEDHEKRHNSLQLDLDKFSIAGSDAVRIYHDGTLTLGKTGRVPRDDVVAYVRRYCPRLVVGGQIELGTLPLRRVITWADAEMFLANVFTYALIRDGFRRDYRRP